MSEAQGGHACHALAKHDHRLFAVSQMAHAWLSAILPALIKCEIVTGERVREFEWLLCISLEPSEGVLPCKNEVASLSQHALLCHDHEQGKGRL